VDGSKSSSLLNELFKGIYSLFTTKPYSWKTFQSTLLKGNGDEFQSELAAFQFETISEPNLKTMRSLKELKGLDAFIKNQKEGEALIDLHGWIMYIPVGYDKYMELVKT